MSDSQGTDMGIEAKCGQCGKKYSVPESWGGKRTQCPQCRNTVEIPVLAIDVFVTDERRNDPFLDAPVRSEATSNPFDTSSARLKTVPRSPRVHTLNALSKRQSVSLADRIWQGPALLIAVGVGMFLAAAWMLMLLGSLGLGYWLLPGAFLLAVGTVILVGGVSNRSVRRNRAAVKSRAVRVVIWLAGGLAAGILSFGGMLLFAKLGNPIPLVVQIGAPFLLVSLLVALMASLVLGYHFLILAFPKANVFRFAVVGYVGLTALIPVLVTVSGVFSRFSRQDQADRRMTTRPDEWEQLRDPSPFIPPGQPAVPEGASRLISSRPPAAPSSRSGRNSTDLAPPSSENSGLPLEAASAPSIGPYGLDPHADLRGNGFGRRGSDGEGLRNPGFRGPGFRGPPSGRPGGGPPAGFMSGRQVAAGQVPDFDRAVQTLAQRFGSERIVTVLVDPVNGEDFQRLTNAIRQATSADSPGHSASLSNGLMKMVVGPINDIHAFAEKLDVGKVLEVDVDGRTITVEGMPVAGQAP